MKDTKKFPTQAPKKRMLLIATICAFVFIVAVGVSYVKEKKIDPAISEAMQIIGRAKELCSYIPNEKDKKKILEGLNQIKAFKAKKENGGSVDLTPGDRFALVIIGYDPGPEESIRVFSFQDSVMKMSQVVIITMNENISTISNNLDAKAVALIHEFIHVLQVNDDMQGLGSGTSIFQRESQAYECQSFLYLQVHPEIKDILCDCNTLTIQGGNTIDPIVSSLVLFVHCRNDFLKTIYDPTK